MSIKILIVDDDPDIRDVMNITLSQEGYNCAEAADGEEGLAAIAKNAPDIVLVDYKMPRMNGLEVCKRIKSDILLRHLPIIMVTGKGEINDKLLGIDAGADDYIVKPFEPKELLAHIRMVLRRSSIDQESNPLTRLPGNVSILNELSQRIESNNFFAVCYADLNNFKAYNDKYGFERGDNVIKETARCIITAAKECGTPADFIGHIGGDDFVIVTTPEKAAEICQKIIDLFDNSAPSFFNEEDLKTGYILVSDRQGKELQIPLMTIAIGVVTNQHRKIANPLEVGEIGAEIKHYAKKSSKSHYAIDQRKGS